MHGPSPSTRHPIEGAERVGLLKNFITRFDEETRWALEGIAWWDWDAEKITRNVRAICSGDL